jgi:Sulfatase
LSRSFCLGIANDTIVVYSTDNGPHMNSWPDGGMTPFRNEKNSNWEGVFRVPAMMRWPGHIKRAPCRTSCSLVSTGFRRCSQPPEQLVLLFQRRRPVVAMHVQELPPSQRPQSFSIDQIMEQMQKPAGG